MSVGMATAAFTVTEQKKKTKKKTGDKVNVYKEGLVMIGSIMQSHTASQIPS